ncbi:MAG: phosphoribosylglycinamide formyltransferase [Bacteroidota bacterium]
MKRIFLLASGSGSNAEAIVRHFSGSDRVEVAGIATNNPKAGVIERAARLGVPCQVFDRTYFRDPEGLLKLLQTSHTDLLVLAGFLWLVPEHIVHAFPGRILNIHPALLPEFGGKGYYGQHVHEAVIAARKVMSGITIHQVNEQFDEGAIVFQAACHVAKEDSPQTLATKVHALEHKFYPVVIEKYLSLQK